MTDCHPSILKAGDRAYVNAIRTALPNNFPSVLEDVLLSYANDVNVKLRGEIVRGVKSLAILAIDYPDLSENAMKIVKKATQMINSGRIGYCDLDKAQELLKSAYPRGYFNRGIIWARFLEEYRFSRQLRDTNMTYTLKPQRQGKPYFEWNTEVHYEGVVKACPKLMRSLYWNKSGYWDSIPRIKTA